MKLNGQNRATNKRWLLAAMVAAVSQGTLAAPVSNGATLEEVIVTAERRAIDLQDTPVSVSAFTEMDLERLGIEDVQDLSYYTPNLSIKGRRGDGDNRPDFVIRGVNTARNSSTSERAVALYVDGIYVPRTNGSILRMLDIDQVEVLRGPQGTLFGRNSIGGAVRINTRRPEAETGGSLRVALSDEGRQDVVGLVNIPLTDDIALRVQGARLQEDGYVRLGGDDLGERQDDIGRAQLQFGMDPENSVVVSALISNSHSTGSPWDYVSMDLSPGSIEGNHADWLSDALEAAGQPRLDTVNDPRIVRDDYTQPDFCLIDDFDPDWDRACSLKNDNRYQQYDVRVNRSLADNLQLTWTSGWATSEYDGVTDWIMVGTEIRPEDGDADVLQHELQLASTLFDGRLDMVSGINYFRERTGSEGYRLTRRSTSTFSPAGGAANGNADAGLFRTVWVDVNQRSESIGLFNDASWHFNDRATLSAGLRYTNETKDFRQRNPAAADFIPAEGTTQTVVEGNEEWNELDWRFALSYDFTDDIMGYVSASKAFRSGEYAPKVNSLLPGDEQSRDLKPLDPEAVVSYEIGARAEFFERTVRINPTFFLMEWSDRQASAQVVCADEGLVTCPLGYRTTIVSSGDVDLWGMELDAAWVINDYLSLEGTYGILRYGIDDEVANGGPYLNPAQPKNMWSLAARWDQPLADAGLLSIGLNYSRLSDQAMHQSKTSDNAWTMNGYGLLDLQAAWVPAADSPYRVTLAITNLLDETWSSSEQRSGGAYWDNGSGRGVAAPKRVAVSELRGRPREVTLGLKYEF